MSSELFSPVFVPDAMRSAVSDEAWLQALLDAEAALAAAQARAGMFPSEAAEAIRAACRAERFDAARLGREARGAGNVVVPLANALRAQLPEDVASRVHLGATSQDIMDTASMLVARRALGLVLSDLDELGTACARLAEEHVSTLMAGRTVMQQAVPITFGLKAAGWLVAVLEAGGLLRSCRKALTVELGGAAGSLASLGDRGIQVLGLFAAELELAEPTVPWHTARARVANLGASLAITAGTMAKVALDILLMSQTEVAEIAEPLEAGRGGSSAMPHKRNPIGATLAGAAARRVQGSSAILLGAMVQEHERAAGAWHAEWEALRDCLALTGGATAWMLDVLEGLEVFPGRMRANLELTKGMVLSERVTLLLTERMGRAEAHRVLEDAAGRVARSGRSLRDELVDDPAEVRTGLSVEEIDDALEPGTYLGATKAFVARALERHRREIEDR